MSFRNNRGRPASRRAPALRRTPRRPRVAILLRSASSQAARRLRRSGGRRRRRCAGSTARSPGTPSSPDTHDYSYSPRSPPPRRKVTLVPPHDPQNVLFILFNNRVFHFFFVHVAANGDLLRTRTNMRSVWRTHHRNSEELDFLDCVSVMESRFHFCPCCKVDKSHKCDLCRGKKCQKCCIRYKRKIAPKMPPKRQQQHFRQQRAQQAPAPGQQGYQHTPLSQVRNLRLERQLATAFYHIAAACARTCGPRFFGPQRANRV